MVRYPSHRVNDPQPRRHIRGSDVIAGHCKLLEVKGHVDCPGIAGQTQRADRQGQLFVGTGETRGEVNLFLVE